MFFPEHTLSISTELEITDNVEESAGARERNVENLRVKIEPAVVVAGG
jgi:hypothetical protein